MNPKSTFMDRQHLDCIINASKTKPQGRYGIQTNGTVSAFSIFRSVK